MAWSIEFEEGIEKQLARLSKSNSQRIVDYLENRVATTDPRSLGQALHGDLRGLWRYRVGDYRIIAKLEDKNLIVLVVDIGHRGEVYR